MMVRQKLAREQITPVAGDPSASGQQTLGRRRECVLPHILGCAGAWPCIPYARVLDAWPFLNTADCPHCKRTHVVEGHAPLGLGHRPHYFECECGRKIMAVVPAGAEIRSLSGAGDSP
jgi:hypothetical protein